MWPEWCAVICFCLSVSNEATSVHHKKQTNSTVATPAVSGGNLSSSVEGWLASYWYVLLVVLLVVVVTVIFACACVVKKARGNHTHYHMDATSTQSTPPFAHPLSRPPLSVVDGSLSPGMASMEQSPVPSPQPSYSSQQSCRSSGRSSMHKKKRTLSPGQNSSGSEETIRSDKGMLRGSWQQQKAPNAAMVKLSISGMALEQQNNMTLPEATSMLSVRSNHSGRSSHSARSGHTHSDASSQKTVVEVDVKLHLSPDQDQDARMMTAAALAESARQLAHSAAQLGEEEEPYQVFSHSPPRAYCQPRVASSQAMRGLEYQQQPLPLHRDVSSGRMTTPLTCTTISLDRAVSLDHPVYLSSVPRGKHGHLSPASPLTSHRSTGSDSKRSIYPTPSHSPTKLLSSGLGSLDRPHPHSPGKGSNVGVGSLDRPHPHSPTRMLRPSNGSLDRTSRLSCPLQRSRVPSTNSDRSDKSWRYGDGQDPLRQFYEQDGHTSRGSQDGHTSRVSQDGHTSRVSQDGHTSRVSQSTPSGHKHSGVGCHDYSTIDVDGIDVDTIESPSTQNCSVHHHCYEDEMDMGLYTLPHHYLTSGSQDGRLPLSFGKLDCGNVPMETRVTKRQLESCAENSEIQTTSFSEEPFQQPPSPCCSSSAPSIEEEPQGTHTKTVVREKQQPLSTTHQQHIPPTSSHQMATLPRSNSGLSADEQLSTASGYAATGSASSIDTRSNGPPSQSNHYELEPRTLRHSSHTAGVSQCDLDSPAGAHQWDSSSPDLTPREQSHDHNTIVPHQPKRKLHNISTNWMSGVKYSNHGDEESISVDV